MKLNNKRNKHYVALRISLADRKFLQYLKKSVPTATFRDSEKLLARSLSCHIKALSVMHDTMVLEIDGSISKKESKAVFDELDRTFGQFVRAVNKNIRALAKRKKIKKSVRKR